MAGDEHWEFVVTVPAGTTIASPRVFNTLLPSRKMVSLNWTIPVGPSGTLGWRFLSSGVQVIPVNKGAWLIRDGADNGAVLAGLPDSGDWQVQAYNTGTLPHAIYVTYYASVIKPPPLPLPTPFGLDELQQGYNSPLVHPIAARS